MPTLPPGQELAEKDVRIYLDSKVTDPTSLANGHVQHIACALQPLSLADSGAPTLVDASRNLLEALFPGQVTAKRVENVHYEIKLNPPDMTLCWKCTSLGIFEVAFGTEKVIVELRESLHFN